MGEVRTKHMVRVLFATCIFQMFSIFGAIYAVIIFHFT